MRALCGGFDLHSINHDLSPRGLLRPYFSFDGLGSDAGLRCNPGRSQHRKNQPIQKSLGEIRAPVNGAGWVAGNRNAWIYEVLFEDAYQMHFVGHITRRGPCAV